jgi:Na+/H+ antiporter NhaC
MPVGPDWTSILPPLLAIGLAIVSRRVIPALLAGIWLGYWLLDDAGPLQALATGLDGILAVLGNPGDARVIAFALVIGAMIGIMEAGGGVRGLVRWLVDRRWVDSPVRAQWLAWGTGIVIFIESNLTLLVAGAVSRPLFDRFRLSRERLAYLIDATSAPVCILIPLNAWGAFNLGLLEGTGVDDPLGVFLAAIPLNLYAIGAVVLAALSIRLSLAWGPMARADARTREGRLLWSRADPVIDAAASEDAPPGQDEPPGRARIMVFPIAVLVGMVPLGLWLTGDGDPAAGSGSTAVLWGVLAGLAAAWLLARLDGRSSDQLASVALRGAGGLLPVALILLLALALGDVAADLGTGRWLAAVVSAHLSPVVLPVLVFLVAAATAFSIGSSWGTFAIMIPLAVPLAMDLQLSPALFLAAALSGGVFGDHASPISDTTVVASMAAATDHIDHVRTQLPFALVAAGVAAAGFLLLGAMTAV